MKHFKCQMSNVKFFLFMLMFIFVAGVVYAQGPAAPVIPKITIGVEQAKTPKDLSLALQIFILLTLLSLAPAIVIMVTSFVRIVVVFSFVRQALGVQTLPPNQVLIALSLFLTFFIMSPVISRIQETAWKPLQEGKIDTNIAFQKGLLPVRDFMFRQTREKDIALFVRLGKLKQPKNRDEVPTHVLVPAFMISELKTAFQIGFVVFIPFLIVDMVVSSTLMSMGMLMLPPIMISLPFKILLFVMVDGWHLITRSLVLSFH